MEPDSTDIAAQVEQFRTFLRNEVNDILSGGDKTPIGMESVQLRMDQYLLQKLKEGGYQPTNAAIFFQLPFTWNLASKAIVRSTIPRGFETTMDFLLKRACRWRCGPLFCSG